MNEIENITLSIQSTSALNMNAQVDTNLSLNMFARSISATGILYNTTAFWNSRKTLISQKGCIYVYSDYYSQSDQVIPALKVGDGAAYLIDLPFIDDGLILKMKSHIENQNIHVSTEDRTKWDNASTYNVDGENLKIGGTF